MNIVDSSGWLEFFADGPNAKYFSGPLERTDQLLVPTIIFYEVSKVILRERGEDAVLQVIAAMKQGTAVALTDSTALFAAQISLHYKLPMADSIILATAQHHQATLWTQDDDFKGIPNVKYFPKQKLAH